MTSSNEPPGGPAGQGRRRPPTIDLRATEVGQGGESAAGAASPGAEQASQPRAGRGWLPPGFSWPMASRFPWGLTAAGAGGAAIILALLAMAGVFSNRDSSSTAVAERRIARLEQQLRELSARPLPSAANPKVLDELAGRLGRLETALATPKAPITDAALANRLAALGGDIKALSERIDMLGRRSDETGSIAADARKRADAVASSLAELRKTEISATASIPREEIEALSGRIAALERTAKTMEAQLAARAGEVGADRALRLVVVASALNAAVERGAPFVAEIAAAKSVASDPKLLAALEPFAQSGVPTPAVLTRELTALVPALAKAVGTPPRDTGVLDRLKANAERLVRIRPLDDAVGDDPVTVVRRIELEAEHGNLAGAAADIAKLPPPARELAKQWMARVEGRAAAIDASRRFAADALAALGKPSL